MTRHVGGLDYQPNDLPTAHQVRTLARRYAEQAFTECMTHWLTKHEQLGREFEHWLSDSRLWWTGTADEIHDPGAVFVEEWHALWGERANV